MPPKRTLKLLLFISALLLATLACQSFLSAPPEVAPEVPPPAITIATATSATTLVETPAIAPLPTIPAGSAGASIGDPYAPELGNTGYDVSHYIIQITLDPAQPKQVSAQVLIEAVSTSDELTHLSLDFIGFEIDSLEVDGTTASHSRIDDKLVITLPQTKQIGDSFNITVAYHGAPVRRASRFVSFEASIGLIYPEGETLFIASEPDGARYWFPCNDHPRDKATFRIEATVPAGLTAVSNGTLLKKQPTDNRQTIFIWEHNHPMATYLATVVVGEYELTTSQSPNGIPLRDYVFPDLRLAERAFANTGPIVDWMSEMLGPYPFDVYGHVTINEAGFSLETQTISMIAVFMLSEDVVVHELAHSWFGNWVSLDSWGEIWRNEGFATYFEWLWHYRDDPAGFEEEMNALTRDAFSNQFEPLNELSPKNMFGYESYVKGAVVVHQLRLQVGDQAFFDGLRLYFARYGGGTASDADFQAVMEEVSGQDLDAFFADWLSR